MIDPPQDQRGARHALYHDPVPDGGGVLAGCRTLEAMREHVANPDPAGLWSERSPQIRRISLTAGNTVEQIGRLVITDCGIPTVSEANG